MRYHTFFETMRSEEEHASRIKKRTEEARLIKTYLFSLYAISFELI